MHCIYFTLIFDNGKKIYSQLTVILLLVITIINLTLVNSSQQCLLCLEQELCAV